MHAMTEIARRLLETRRSVKELERVATETGELTTFETLRLSIFRGALQALAWTLEIDLAQIDTPPTLAGAFIEPTMTVQLHRIEVGAEPHESRVMWLVEIPAHQDADDPGFNTEAWSCFFSEEQAEELHRALGDVLLPAPIVPSPVRLLGFHPLVRQRQRQRQQPSGPDIEGGYAGGLGGPQLPPPPPPPLPPSASAPSRVR